MNNELQQTPIPEWFENWITGPMQDEYEFTNDGQKKFAAIGAIAAYRLLSDQGLRWVKSSAELPPENKLVYCRTSRGRKIVTSAAKGEWDNYWLNEDEESVIEWLLEPQSPTPIT